MIINVHQDQARADIDRALAMMRQKFPCGLLLVAMPERRVAVAKMWNDEQAHLALVHCLATDDRLLETVSRACLQAHVIRDDARKAKGEKG